MPTRVRSGRKVAASLSPTGTRWRTAINPGSSPGIRNILQHMDITTHVSPDWALSRFPSGSTGGSIRDAHGPSGRAGGKAEGGEICVVSWSVRIWQLLPACLGRGLCHEKGILAPPRLALPRLDRGTQGNV